MRNSVKLAAAFAMALPLMGFAAAGTAQARDNVSVTLSFGAQPVHYDGHRNGYGRHASALPPRAVRQHLRNYYREVSQPERRGDVYVARAEDRNGRDIRVTVNAYTGEVIHAQYTRRDHDRRDDRRDRRWGY